ncbi:MAG: carboxypeptidase M32 [Actinobacteria bacterium]|nr:carboxypeptidase M32 [Actinomycetota bacterium]
MHARFDELRTRLAEIHDLAKAAEILRWDEQVMMPPRGAAARAEQLATLNRVTHDRFTSPEIGRLLDDLAPFEEQHDFDSFEASLIRVTRRDWEKERKVPSDLRASMSRTATLGYATWVEARRTDDFSRFLPALREALELKRQYVACFDGDYDEPYDALLDDYEPGMKTAEVRETFEYLKEHQAPLVKEVVSHAGTPDQPTREFPVERQKEFELDVVRRFGFDPDSWRLDPTVHPFERNGSLQDIRITTRYFPTNLDGLFATMHEFGHGLYEHQVDPQLERTPLASGVSLAMHESQSRMWENLVGRSLPFWRFAFPRLAQLFPDAVAGEDAESWYREVNAVEPSLIRVEADEATYNLHIILRFELEQELLAGSFPLEQLQEEWDRRMWEYLGIEVPDAARGVLQDMHWSIGAVGYFSTYALGNLISAQIWAKVTDDLPDLDDRFEQGEFGALAAWLRENVHRHGRKFTPLETLERATGATRIDPEPYVRYLRRKLGDIYGLPVVGSR